MKFSSLHLWIFNVLLGSQSVAHNLLVESTEFHKTIIQPKDISVQIWDFSCVQFTNYIWLIVKRSLQVIIRERIWLTFIFISQSRNSKAIAEKFVPSNCLQQNKYVLEHQRPVTASSLNIEAVVIKKWLIDWPSH